MPATAPPLAINQGKPEQMHLDAVQGRRAQRKQKCTEKYIARVAQASDAAMRKKL